MACSHDRTFFTQDGTVLCRDCGASLPMVDATGATVLPEAWTADQIGMALLFAIGALGTVGAFATCIRILLAG